MNKGKMQWIVFGVYYGYPECCIEYFCTRKTYFLTLQQAVVLTGKGFVPCNKCAAKIIDYSIDNGIGLDTVKGRVRATESLILDRICDTPFATTD